MPGMGALRGSPQGGGCDPAFQKADSFQGARPGFAFKVGKQGLGYYSDRLEMEKARAAGIPIGGDSEDRLGSPAGSPRGSPGGDSQGMPPPAFEKCERFEGARPGCVFKKGDKGLGYYADTPPQKMYAGGANRRRVAQAR